jgi:hypothetical protein
MPEPRPLASGNSRKQVAEADAEVALEALTRPGAASGWKRAARRIARPPPVDL